MRDVKKYMTPECQAIYDKYLGCEKYRDYLDNKMKKINDTIENLSDFAIDIPSELFQFRDDTIKRSAENDSEMAKYDNELKKFLKKYHIAVEDHYGHILSYDVDAYSDAHAKEIGKSYGYDAEIFRYDGNKKIDVV